MLGSIEKTFDNAFFSVNHHLKFIRQFVVSLDDTIISENLSEQLEQSFKNIADQLSILAFCFAQLMCKTILFSEKCFILKEHSSQLQMENFHFKSDKSFMDFFRKMNRLCSYNNSNCEQSKVSNRKMKKPIMHKYSKCSIGKVSKQRKVENKKKHTYEKTMVPKKTDQIQFSDDLKSDFENNLIYNLNPEHFKDLRLKKDRYNNAFRLVYKSFKETELIENLKSQNLACQRKIIILESQLSNYNLSVKYLNNQLSGRIQQIQLLTRDKDSNFEKIWNDLESEISLNTFKTISQALNSDNNMEQNALLKLFQSNLLLNLNESNPIHNCISKAMDDEQTSDDSSKFQREDEKVFNDFFWPINYKNFQRSWFNIGLFRFVIVNIYDNSLGISITGGKEYGLPILISKIYPSTPAHKANAFIPGDIILSVNFTDITDMTYEEAVNLLKNLSGQCRFGVIHLKPDSSTENDYNQSLEIIKKLSYTDPLNDIEKLCLEYYRSILNSTLMWPFHLTSDDSSSESYYSQQSDDDDCHHTDDDDDSNVSSTNNWDDVKTKQSTNDNPQTPEFNARKIAVPGIAKLIPNTK